LKKLLNVKIDAIFIFQIFHVIHNEYLKGAHWISWEKGIAWMFRFQNDTQNFMLSPKTLRKIAKVFFNFYAPLISQLPFRSYGCSTLWVTWKIQFSPIQTIFHGKNGPNSPNFKEKTHTHTNCQTFMISSSRLPRI
jgi:hypothetical protein